MTVTGTELLTLASMTKRHARRQRAIARAGHTADVAAVGGLSKPSKMPSKSWSLPASACKTGARLRGIKGSICSHCYACKGQYVIGAAPAATARRLAAYRSLGAGKWAMTMARVIAWQPSQYFRWFDSGDVQDEFMFAAIALIAATLPTKRFWLPTKEWRFCQGPTPENLVVRFSDYHVDQASGAERSGVHASGCVDRLGWTYDAGRKAVTHVSTRKGEVVCQASKRGGR